MYSVIFRHELKLLSTLLSHSMYEVPCSEHCSFGELREFVRFISPEHIIPSVNNDGPQNADAMRALLLSDT